MVSLSFVSLLLVVFGINEIWTAELGTGIGCRQENTGDRMIPKILFQDRILGKSTSSGYLVNWKFYSAYLVGLRKRCVDEGRKQGFDFVALQNWGECWAGSDPPSNTGYSKMCYNGLFEECPPFSWATCVGTGSTNYIYCLDNCEKYEQ